MLQLNVIHRIELKTKLIISETFPFTESVKKVYLVISLQMFALEQVNQNYNNFSFHHLVEYFSIYSQCITMAFMGGTTGHYKKLSA